MVSINTPSVYDFLMRMVNKQKNNLTRLGPTFKIRGEMSVNPSGKKERNKTRNFIKNHRGVGSALSLREKGGGG
jgi:hypothetical protein